MQLRLENISKYYEKDSIRINIIKNISYEFNNNLYIIYGPHYSGKTVLLNLLSFEEKLSSGYIMINNISYKNRELKKIKNTYISYIKENDEVTPKMIKTINNLDIVSLSSKRNLNIDYLSNYDKIRILIANSLKTNPKILLIDCQLDILTRQKQELILDLLNKISKDRIVIITTRKQLIKNQIFLNFGRIAR